MGGAVRRGDRPGPGVGRRRPAPHRRLQPGPRPLGERRPGRRPRRWPGTSSRRAPAGLRSDLALDLLPRRDPRTRQRPVPPGDGGGVRPDPGRVAGVPVPGVHGCGGHAGARRCRPAPRGRRSGGRFRRARRSRRAVAVDRVVVPRRRQLARRPPRRGHPGRRRRPGAGRGRLPVRGPGPPRRRPRGPRARAPAAGSRARGPAAGVEHGAGRVGRARGRDQRLDR